jgi:hypothetical protein
MNIQCGGMTFWPLLLIALFFQSNNLKNYFNFIKKNACSFFKVHILLDFTPLKLTIIMEK